MRLLSPRLRILKLKQFPSETGIAPIKTKGHSKTRGKTVHGYDETFELIIAEIKTIEQATFPKWFGNVTCQQRDLKKKQKAEMYTGASLALESVVVEGKALKFGTIPEWFGNLTCDKRDWAEYLR